MIAKPFLELMQQHTRDDILSDNAIFKIQAFSNDKLLENSDIDWDPETLTIKVKMADTHSVHRIVISETKITSYLDQKWVCALYRYLFYPPLSISNRLRQSLGNPVTLVIPPEITRLAKKLFSNNTLDNVYNWMQSNYNAPALQPLTYKGYDYFLQVAAYKVFPYAFPDDPSLALPVTYYTVFVQSCMDLGYLDPDDGLCPYLPTFLPLVGDRTLHSKKYLNLWTKFTRK